jgi:protein-tyrosine kinase
MDPPANDAVTSVSTEHNDKRVLPFKTGAEGDMSIFAAQRPLVAELPTTSTAQHARTQIYGDSTYAMHAPVHAAAHAPVHAPMHAPVHAPMHAPVHAPTGLASGTAAGADAQADGADVTRAASPANRSGPLHIRYSQTRVEAALLSRLERTPGVVRMDRSSLAETFKMLRSQLFQRLRADGHSLLAVTSPRDIEGKSLTALNIAMTMAAEFDSTVLLVDADLSGQGLQSLLGLGPVPGLSDHLSLGTPLPELLINPGLPRLVVLPAGTQPLLNSVELLGTRAAQQLFQELKHRYPDRCVVVDLPPLLNTADALTFLPQADTTLLVVEEHTTTIADMEGAASLLARFNLMGAVISKRREDGAKRTWEDWRDGDRGAITPPRRWWQKLLRGPAR